MSVSRNDIDTEQPRFFVLVTRLVDSQIERVSKIKVCIDLDSASATENQCDQRQSLFIWFFLLLKFAGRRHTCHNLTDILILIHVRFLLAHTQLNISDLSFLFLLFYAFKLVQKHKTDRPVSLVLKDHRCFVVSDADELMKPEVAVQFDKLAVGWSDFSPLLCVQAWIKCTSPQVFLLA